MVSQCEVTRIKKVSGGKGYVSMVCDQESRVKKKILKIQERWVDGSNFHSDEERGVEAMRKIDDNYLMVMRRTKLLSACSDL